MIKLVRTVICCIALLMALPLDGQTQSIPAQAFENVIIHTADGQVIRGGTIVWRDGLIHAVGKEVAIPFDAFVRDGGDSLHVYPGFIDGMALWGSPGNNGHNGTPEEPGNPGYRRAGIQPHRFPSNHLKTNDDAFSKAVQAGFTTAALAMKGEMMPGQVDLFFINEDLSTKQLLQRGMGIVAQFKEAKGSAYPSTTMGVMAQFRQLFYDAEAQLEQQRYFAAVSSSYPAPPKEKVLEALYPVMQQQQPFFFVANSEQDIKRMFWLQDELKFKAVLVSGREAYKTARELKKRDIPVLAGIDFPEKPEWMRDEEKDKDDQELTPEQERFRERQQKAYRQHMQNIKSLQDAGVNVGFASYGLKVSDVRENLTLLKEEGGLDSPDVLHLLSQSTADILGYGQRMGDLKEGLIANFTVFNKAFSEDKARALYSISNGKVTEFESETDN